MRVNTGITNLDYLMGGGFLRGSFNLVYGGGGSGKTLFTVKYLLEGTKKGENVLYISLEESWKDVQANLPASLKRDLDRNRSRFHYLDFGSLRPILGRDVLKSEVLSEAIGSSVVVHKITRIGLDGIAPLFTHYEGENAMRNAIFNISQNLRKYGATTVFTSEEINGRSRYGVEEYIADSVIHLTYDGRKRRLEIIKVRGSGFIGGKHGFEINDDGLFVYPRKIPTKVRSEIKIEDFGIPQIDTMLGETYAGDVTLVVGPPGTGKTLIAIQFLATICSRGKKGLFVSFESQPAIIHHSLKAMGYNPANCKIIYRNPADIDFYKLIWDIYHHAKDVHRVVFDGINSLGYDDEYRDFMNAVLHHLKGRGISTMLTYTNPEIISSYKLGNEYIIYLSDNIINLRYAEIGGELKRVIVVIKSHSPTHERDLIEYRISKRGINVMGKIEEMEGIMSGIPRRQVEIKKRVEKFFR